MEKNIYQLARETKGITQEKAAELLGIDCSTLRKYELGDITPNGKRVADMIDIYDTQWLAYKHLRNTDTTNTLPELSIRTLEGASLNFIKELKDVNELTGKLLSITCDGVIQSDEKEEWLELLKEIEELMAASITLKYAVCN